MVDLKKKRNSTAKNVDSIVFQLQSILKIRYYEGTNVTQYIAIYLIILIEKHNKRMYCFVVETQDFP